MVTIAATADGAEKPAIIGTTNLPDGIELMVTVRRRESAYMAQDKARVREGAFRAGPFSNKGAALNPGTYTIEVTMPSASLQPPPTWPVIGNGGVKLEGPLAKTSRFGGKVVEFKTTFKVGSGQRSPERDKAARAESARDSHAWWLRSCTSTCNLTQEYARRHNESFDWQRCYYKCVADEPQKK
jgi:hypothetical protein